MGTPATIRAAPIPISIHSGWPGKIESVSIRRKLALQRICIFINAIYRGQLRRPATHERQEQQQRQQTTRKKNNNQCRHRHTHTHSVLSFIWYADHERGTAFLHFHSSILSLFHSPLIFTIIEFAKLCWQIRALFVRDDLSSEERIKKIRTHIFYV